MIADISNDMWYFWSDLGCNISTENESYSQHVYILQIYTTIVSVHVNIVSDLPIVILLLKSVGYISDVNRCE